MESEDFKDRLAHFEARTKQYQELGHDRFEAAGFVAGACSPFSGPVLDVGTGKGLLAMALARREANVISIDVNAEDQEFAARLADREGLSERIRFILCDAVSLPFPEGRFSTCAMMDVLHHLDNPDRVLGEMVRVLSPGGELVASDFSAKGFDLVASVHAAEGREHPRGQATMAWADQFLRNSGMERTAVKDGHLHNVALYRKPQ
ncbi:MAG: class I SAM-dependent methyltransferase [Acidobacteriota bacterium]